MNEHEHTFFRKNGFLVLGEILTVGEVNALVAQFDRDRATNTSLWRYLGHDTHQTANCEAFSVWPTLEDLVRHPAIFPIAQALMGDTMAVLEISARHMDVHPGEVTIPQQWHRDTPHLPEHDLRLDYLQAMVYLTDVNEETHCFTISPESSTDPILDTDDQLDRGGMQHLYGPPGTVILFNASVLHTATVRESKYERKTIQIYYCHRHRKKGERDLVDDIVL